MRTSFIVPVTMLLIAASPFSLFLLGGCGGSSAPSAGAAKDPTSAAASADLGSSPPAPSQASTTTLALGDGGDLQGSRLTTTNSTTSAASNDGKGGSSSGTTSHKGEPGRTAEDVRTIILTRRDEFRACFDQALASHPGIGGDLDMKWLIDPKGVVTDVGPDEGRSTIHEPSVSKCVGEIIKKIKFNESAKGVETRTHYPFNFNPKSAGKLGAPDSGH